MDTLSGPDGDAVGPSEPEQSLALHALPRDWWSTVRRYRFQWRFKTYRECHYLNQCMAKTEALKKKIQGK